MSDFIITTNQGRNISVFDVVEWISQFDEEIKRNSHLSIYNESTEKWEIVTGLSYLNDEFRLHTIPQDELKNCIEYTND